MQKRSFTPRVYEDSPQTRDLAINSSLKFLSFRPRSKKEVQMRLKQKGFPEITVEATIEKLKELKFLNDEEFAKWWIEQRQNSRGRGKMVIKQELSQKGIDRSLIDATFEDSQDDYKTAKTVFEKYQHRFEGLDYKDFYRKAGSFLQRRGFSFDVVKKILDEYKK